MSNLCLWSRFIFIFCFVALHCCYTLAIAMITHAVRYNSVHKFSTQYNILCWISLIQNSLNFFSRCCECMCCDYCAKKKLFFLLVSVTSFCDIVIVVWFILVAITLNCVVYSTAAHIFFVSWIYHRNSTILSVLSFIVCLSFS